MLSAVYGQAARARRAWYARRRQARRRLPHPVVSVGNLVVGGSGKTPLVAHLSRLLLDAGERPVVLSRGYARRVMRDGVVVVSDGRGVRASVDAAGDEPYMLATGMPDVPVLVSEDRFLGGQLGASEMAATVFLLDDGFQHLQLARDVDLLLLHPGDLDEAVVPSGRLREPLSAARAADAVIVPASADDARAVAARLGVSTAFRVEASYDALRPTATQGPPAADRPVRPPWPGQPVFALSGIARPERFVAALERQGWPVAGHLAFRDHHWFTEADVARAEARALDAGAVAIVTTEKDGVRLPARGSLRLPWFVLPMRVRVEPGEEFRAWLLGRVSQARQQAGSAAP
jgi:tetraacyldisaccharide 4'-kinase